MGVIIIVWKYILDDSCDVWIFSQEIKWYTLGLCGMPKIFVLQRASIPFGFLYLMNID